MSYIKVKDIPERQSEKLKLFAEQLAKIPKGETQTFKAEDTNFQNIKAKAKKLGYVATQRGKTLYVYKE